MLALVAGRGQLPGTLVAALAERPYVVALEGFDPDTLDPDRRFRVERLGTLLTELKTLGVTEVCFAGAIGRPPIDPGEIDAATLPLVPKMMAALQMGDDGALRTVLAIFEDHGFAVRAAHEIVPSLLPDAAVHSKRQTDDPDRKDAARAAEVMAGLGALDVGQSCAVRAGQVLSIEGVFGTDWMLASLAARPDAGGGVFYKASKPGQDRRIDLPVVGVETVKGVSRAGLDGLVIEAGGVMVLDLPAVLRSCDELDLFFWVRPS